LSILIWLRFAPFLALVLVSSIPFVSVR